jgi:hypothetical protein
LHPTFATKSAITGNRRFAYSITSSARSSSDVGTSTPSALAVFEVRHQFEFGWLLDRQVGGFAPLKILNGRGGSQGSPLFVRLIGQ